MWAATILLPMVIQEQYSVHVMSSGSQGRVSLSVCESITLFWKVTPNKGRKKNNKLNFLWPKMARLGPQLWPPKSPRKKFMWVFCLRSFPGNEAHKLFSGGPKSGVLVGGQKVMLKTFMCFLCPLPKPFRERKTGSLRKGSFSLEESLGSLKSLDSLENGRITLCLPQSSGSLESLEHGFSWKDTFSKRPRFPNPTIDVM